MNTISKKSAILSFLVLTLVIISFAGFKSISGLNPVVAEYPQASITNGLINMKLYLPDSVNGYYRGSRFDWSGVIPELQYNGHDFFGQWFQKYDPYLHDAIMGPVNDFAPLGYDEAKPGETYVKIGIGVLVRPDTMPYSISKQTKLVNGGKWNVSTKPNQVTFNQILNDKDYSYEYTKTISLADNEPVMVLTHKIVNHGKKTINTNVYNHNFFVIDRHPTGPDFLVEFPFTLKGQFRRGADIAEYSGNKIVFLKELTLGQTVHGGNIEGFGNTPSDYNIRIENKKAGAGVRITCDQPLSRLVFWASYITLAAEPYNLVTVAPSESFTWTIRYEFYTL